VKSLSLSVRQLLLPLGAVAAISFLLGHYLPPWFNEVSGRKAGMSSLYYHHTLALQLRGDELQPDDSIVFLGDSITQSLPVATITPIGLNYGIGTDTTKGLLARIPLYSSLEPARAIVLAIGINDMVFDENDVILQRYQQVLDSLPDNANIICSAVMPVRVSAMRGYGAINTQRIKDFNVALKTLCENHNHHFSETPAGLMNAQGELDTPFDDNDGLHLNSAGYAIWVKHLQAQFAMLGLPVHQSSE